MAYRPPNMPSDDEWRALFKATQAFAQQKPWTWMSDGDIFGVYDPETKQIGYCSVMGAMGEVLALAVYLGPWGYMVLEQLKKATVSPTSLIDLGTKQYALMVALDNREDLEEEDLGLIRHLELTFRGRQAWPTFRFYEPGFGPSLLTGSQARFLTRAIGEALTVSEQVRFKPDFLNRPDQKILVRKPVSQGADIFKSTWATPPRIQIPIAPLPSPDVLQSVQALPLSGDIWEADIFYLPITIGTGNDRPLVPQGFLLMDHHRDQILKILMAEDNHFLEQIRNVIIHQITDHRSKPSAIFVRQTDVALQLNTLCQELGIAVINHAVLPGIESAREGLTEWFQNN